MTLFASLEELFERLDAVAQLPLRGAAGLPARLRTHRDAAYLARSLTRIVCDVPHAGAGSARSAATRCRTWRLIDAFCQAQGFGMLLRRQAERLAALDGERRSRISIRPS